MAQVLHMDHSFAGKSNPTSPTALRGKEQDLPYSVETPYGYRLDLDFLKYVNDIEKGNTIKKVPIHRRPRYSSLPRGYGYTGSWWTSTESLCSNASMDSRHSSFSFCAPGYYGSYRPESRPQFLAGGFNPRVEKTLLDARKKLEEDQTDSSGRQRTFSNLGSLHGSVSGSTSSLVGSSLNQSFSKSQNGSQCTGGQYTPMSSGLSTPVSPTPAHLQHIREQMASALRKIRELEEQVKMIPVLQVKISVLQEEKRQLSVQLKSQKFLGHPMGFGKARPRGELYIDIPEEEHGSKSGDVTSPTLAEGSRQDSGCEIEDTVIVGSDRPRVGAKEVRSVGVGTGDEDNEGAKVRGSSEKVGAVLRHANISVTEEDLGLSCAATEEEVERLKENTDGLKRKMTVLETQLKKALQELQTAQQRIEQQGKQIAEKERDAKASVADAVIMTSIGWQDLQESSSNSGEAARLQTVVSFNQPPQKKEQRTVGIQVYTLEQPMVVGVRKCQEVTFKGNKAEFIPQAMKAEDVAGLCSFASRTSLSSEQVRTPSEREMASAIEVPYVTYRCGESTDTGSASSGQKVGDQETKVAGDGTEENKRNSGGGHSVGDSTRELPIAVSSKEVREVLQRCEVSSSVPVSSLPVVMDAIGAVQLVSQQPVPLCQRLREGSALPSVCVSEEQQETALPADPLKSAITKDEEESPSSSEATVKNLHFVGVNGGYESTSSESSSTSSENDSSESEYHEANERLPESQQSAISDEPPAQEPSATGAPQPEGVPSTAQSPPEQAEATPERVDNRFELSEGLIAACMTLQKSLGVPNAFGQQDVRLAYTTVLQEWLRVSCHKAADPEVVCHYMTVFKAMSPQLLEFIVNMADGNGNTALHYTVSHSNFPIVKLLLDTGLCTADKQNKAGYTPIMLTALAAFRSDSDLETVMQLLRTGEVNAKASQAGQTALMLAVSHGRIDMVRALLACGADVNLQDDDGSTALMCACEHGHVEIVKLLLAVPGCDATLTDNDGSTALSIALEASQNDIAVLLYAHLNFAKPPSPVTQKAIQLGTSPPSDSK
ncbi:KN motif and ankyrin repeat domain-containing protein 2 [Polypterus senegalus]